MKPLIVIQARTGSTRLPGKVLLPLLGEPLLARMLERIAAARTPVDLVVATTWEQQDEPIAGLCAGLGVRCFRGHPTDLLERHYVAARDFGATVVVKIPSDCPLIDPAVIDRVLSHFLAERRYDFVSNLHPPSYPDGNDVEVMTFEALEMAYREARRPWEREHTTPFLWDQPDRFRIGNVSWETGLDLSMSHRLTVDYREDYELVAAVFEALYPRERIFSLGSILDFLRDHEEVSRLNADFNGVNWYRHHINELRTIRPEETRIEGGLR